MTRFDQYGQIKALREVRPEIMAWGVCVTRGTLARLDEAFAGYFRRLKAGQTPGYPRFKGQGRFHSVSWPDVSGWRVEGDAKRLYLQGVGHVRLRLHRPLRGEARTITVRRRNSHWDVTAFCASVPAQPLPATGRQVGIDVGVTALMGTSNGDLIVNPRPRKALAERLAAVQQDKARRQRGSVRYRRANQAIARVKRKEANVRKDHLHKVSRALVDTNDVICHETLKITNMVRRPSPLPEPDTPGGFLPNGAAAKAGLNNAISDSGWGTLLSMTVYKAEDAGRAVIAVNPYGTSLRCHACGHMDKANRINQAMFRCQRCHNEANADINPARNILRAGLALHLGAKPETTTPVE